MAARGFIGAGDIYIERIISGVPQGLAGPYYADKFEIKPNVEVKELTSKGRNDYGQTLESVAIQQPADFTLDLKEVNKESLTIAMLGSQAQTSQAAGTLTNQAVAAKLDRWVAVGKENLGTIVVKDDSDTTTFVVDVDYKVNPQLGLIKALPGGQIMDGDELHISGPHLAVSATVISGATSTDIRARLIFDGINQADGLPVIVKVHEAIIAADSAFDFLADDFNTVSLPGKMKTPTGKNEPFTIELRNAQT